MDVFDVDGFSYSSHPVSGIYRQVDLDEYEREYSNLKVNQYLIMIRDFNRKKARYADLMEEIRHVNRLSFQYPHHD